MTEKVYELYKHINNPVIVCSADGVPIYKNATAGILSEYGGASDALDALYCSCRDGGTLLNRICVDALGVEYDVVATPQENGSIMLLLDNKAYRSKRRHVLYDFQMEAIIDSMSDGLFITDRHGVTLTVNKTYEEIFGISSEEVVGRYVGTC